MKIKTVIIDDEEKSIITLRNLINEYCENLEIIATANSVKTGIATISQHKPDLVFLDIAMPDGDGFQVLESIEQKTFEVIFTTAYNEYATKAFEFAALHYLLKPINLEELLQAIDRYTTKNNPHTNQQRFEILQKGLNEQFQRIALPSAEGISFVNLDQIIRCEASKNYTIFYLNDKTQTVVSKSLNNYEKLLEGSFFFRVHHKHLINLKYVKKYVKGKGGYVVMNDDFSVDVSVRKKDDFLKIMSALTGL